MLTDCRRNAKNGVLDMEYIEHRLDSIEARIDDLCGLLGEVLERIDSRQTVTEITIDPKVDTVSHPCLLIHPYITHAAWLALRKVSGN